MLLGLANCLMGLSINVVHKELMVIETQKERK